MINERQEEGYTQDVLDAFDGDGDPDLLLDAEVEEDEIEEEHVAGTGHDEIDDPEFDETDGVVDESEPDEFDVDPEDEPEEDVAEAESEGEVEADPETEVEESEEAAEVEAAEKIPEGISVEDWASTPQAMKDTYTKLESDRLSALGRARVMKSKLAEQEVEPEPVPTEEMIMEAAGDPEKLEEMQEDYPQMAASLQAAVKGVAQTMDLRQAQTLQQVQIANNEARVQARLDRDYPEWEEWKDSDPFKTWVYAGGPGADEAAEYDRLIALGGAAGAYSTEQSKLYKAADTFYNGLLNKYPVWASDKGDLYAAPSFEAAGQLLTRYAGTMETLVPEGDSEEQTAAKAKKKARLVANIAPTKGKGTKLAPDNSLDAEEALDAGFNT